MGFLRDWVLRDWGLKLLALGISFFLWTTYTAEPFGEAGYLVPLEFRNIPRNLEISGDVPTQVHVRVRGRPSLLRRFTPADLDLSVDLNGAKEGEKRIELYPDQVTAPYGATVVRVTPKEVRVLLVRRQDGAASP